MADPSREQSGKQDIRPVMLLVLDGFGWRASPISIGYGAHARTLFCAHPAVTSACRMGRWATRKSAI